MNTLSNVKVVLALGKIGFDGYLRYIKQNFDIILKDYPFGHDKNITFRMEKSFGVVIIRALEMLILVD